MRRLIAGMVLVLGLALLGYAGFSALNANHVVRPPAPFAETSWTGAVPALPKDVHYEPSDEIRGLAVLRSAGLWPLSHSWYEYAPKGQVPVAGVVLLHGAGRDGLSMLEMWRATADRHQLLLVAPNGGAFRFTALGRRAVEDAAVQAAELHGLAGQGMYIFGHSDGAVLAQAVVGRADPGVWRAAGLHAGYLAVADLPMGASGTPLRLYLGEEDHVFATDAARASLQAIAEQGHPAELVRIARHGHWFYLIGPAIAEDVWNWWSTLPS